MKITSSLLHKYFRNEATREEERLIMDYAESSPENYQWYLEQRTLWNALLLHYKTLDTKKRTYWQIPWKAISIAATIALLIALSWIEYNKKPEETLPGMQSVYVPAGQRVMLILEDGTKVWLNSRSSFSYPTSFGNKTREVKLDGEGFFEVSRNEKIPFIVNTEKYNIKVLGTTFNVNAYSNSNSVFETSLLYGSVKVYDAKEKKQEITLRPKEKVTENGGMLYKTPLDDNDQFRWKEGLICFNDVPFDTLIKTFEKYFDVTIRIKNPQLKAYHCTGKFYQRDGLDYAFRVIQKDLDFQYVRKDEGNSFVIK